MQVITWSPELSAIIRDLKRCEDSSKQLFETITKALSIQEQKALSQSDKKNRVLAWWDTP